MAGLPKLPGLSFTDPTQTRFHRCGTFDIINGYKIPKSHFSAPGGKQVESKSVQYVKRNENVSFDPSTTYGRSKSKTLPQFIPNYAMYDKKCLTFKAFFKQSVVESPLEHYRVRIVNIIYFLEDDTIVVMEPRIINSGLEQGKLIRRHKIPKYESGEFYTWKDLTIGKDLCFYGTVYHTVDCDLFTREYMASQGLIMGEAESVPEDPYTRNRLIRETIPFTKTPCADDKLRRFLEYDGKVLRFKAVWDDRDSEYGELRKYEVFYFLADDGISVKEIHEKNDGRDPFPLLLRKTKLPKIYTDRPVSFPSIYYETSDAETTAYYNPQDLMVGETIFILGRKFLLYDCDQFTRNYYKQVFQKEQHEAIDIVEKPKKQPPERMMPPHDGYGSLEDSLQNTLSFMPKRPKKDVIRQILNANKYLRYTMKMDTVHPEDSFREFILSYSLADSTCKIYEPRVKNSGFQGGQYLSNHLLIKPGSNPVNPDYYNPADFYIGAAITVFHQPFIITGADLYVYRYMLENQAKFPCEVIDNIRNYMYNKGYLKEDVDDQFNENMEAAKIDFDKQLVTEEDIKKSEFEKCLIATKAGGGVDPQEEQMKRDRLLQEYEESLRKDREIPPYGIKPITTTCPIPVVIGDAVKSSVCPEDESNTAQYTPKHIDTPVEKVEKYYANILKKEHKICNEGTAPPCFPAPDLHRDVCKQVEDKTMPLMVQPPELPPGACNVKTVRFADQTDRCDKKKYDLCDIGAQRNHCDCTDYQKK